VPVSGKSGSIADFIHPLPNTSFLLLDDLLGVNFPITCVTREGGVVVGGGD